MMYPLVRELAVDVIPVAVTCRVLKIARQPYCRWLASPVTDAELDEAYRANALFDAHKDPEFGYRFLADEAPDAGQSMAERTAWRICSDTGWWSAFGKKRGRNGKKPGPPVHDDLCAVTVTRDGSGISSPPTPRTSCGSATSPSTAPAKVALRVRVQGRLLQPETWVTPSTLG
jgi:hypothetical protein